MSIRNTEEIEPDELNASLCRNLLTQLAAELKSDLGLPITNSTCSSQPNTAA